MKVGAIMQACRERAGLTQEQLAVMLNRSQSCISKLEDDKKTWDIPTFLNWIDATGAKEVAVAFFLGMDGLTIMQQFFTTGIMLTYWLF
ncbi:helix-turn-helix domain-containing protein [Brevibacillus ruminantium]|uniref:Helix-turn-helix domain-containing protein n=1 Tax=Brevibacillus ruminantium TaxID=2950604 RepID=A0ABY4WB95_9BACL|nr:helix-turn-helix transcriptional regulator [Brevibacillus ruminantium]USG64034.1 helix-turn-helix domain-containing protein [Brevibacillus ruminantium]